MTAAETRQLVVGSRVRPIQSAFCWYHSQRPKPALDGPIAAIRVAEMATVVALSNSRLGRVLLADEYGRMAWFYGDRLDSLV